MKGDKKNMQEFNRGWVLSTEDGVIQKNCANCEKFTQCEKNPKYNYRVCKEFEKLEVENTEW
jgi:hypothetical protein